MRRILRPFARWGRWGRWGRREWLLREQWPKSRERQPGAPLSGAEGRVARTLRAMPRQIVPATEAVELTPAERAAFAGLVRQFGEGRH